MIFCSLTFLCIFLPAVFLLYLILPGIRAKNVLLLVFSILFYAYGEPVYVILLVICALMNYLFGRGLEGRHETGGGRWLLSLAVACNLAVLILFKYAGFLTECANGVLGLSLEIPQIRLPVGISFFTFQAMSYVIDVYRGEARVQKSFGKLLLYISFFPQLVAGPIVKYHDVEREIEARRQTVEDVAEGLRRFIAGLVKKVLLANTLGLAADAVFQAGQAEINVLGAWLGAFSYMLQIYFDFGGYSDMAIGLGRMFGFHFRENFRYPYCAGSIREFWRRWHISLSTWFREYLYIPLGGNRRGRLRTLANRFIVFLCTGIWHGANVTFLFWGIFHGAFITAEGLLEEYGQKRGKLTSKSGRQPEQGSRGSREFEGQERGKPEEDRGRQNNVSSGSQKTWKRALGHLYTLLVVCVGFVFFRADSLGQGIWLVKEMFTGFHFERSAVSFAVCLLDPFYLTVAAVSVAAALPLKEKIKKLPGYEPFSYMVSIGGLFLCILSLAGNGYNPFIYFQF